jgi:pimeloyl-ACP methyl ester carboxylesterase
VWFEGGPGGSGVDVVTKSDLLGLSGAGYDLYGFDARGVGGSQSVHGCSDNASLIVPQNKSQFEKLVEKNLSLLSHCRTYLSGIYLNAREVARDVEEIRRMAIGDDKISLYAHSYGTVAGQAYVRLFGNHVNAAILDGNEDHSRAPSASFPQAAAAVERAMEAFFAWCRTEGCKSVNLCSPCSSPWFAYDTVRNRAVAGQQADPSSRDHRLTPLGLAFNTQASLQIRDYRGLDDFLTKAFNDKSTPSKDSEFALPGNSAFPIRCQDFRSGTTSYEQFQMMMQKAKEEAPHVWMATNALALLLPCIGDDSPSANPYTPTNRDGMENRVLVAGNEFDHITPMAWNRSVYKQYGGPAGAGLLAYQVGGHMPLILRKSPCVKDALWDYLTEPSQLGFDERSCPSHPDDTMPDSS